MVAPRQTCRRDGLTNRQASNRCDLAPRASFPGERETATLAVLQVEGGRHAEGFGRERRRQWADGRKGIGSADHGSTGIRCIGGAGIRCGGGGFCRRPIIRSRAYPKKPVKFVIPYAPGGIADIAARIIGAKLTEAWGQQVVVENKPGGNGTIGVATIAKAAPDGYSLLLATVGDFTVNPNLIKDLAYDVVRDLTPSTGAHRHAMRARGARRRTVQNRRGSDRGRQDEAPQDPLRHARQRQHQPADHGMGRAWKRHQISAHSVQRWSAGRGIRGGWRRADRGCSRCRPRCRI